MPLTLPSAIFSPAHRVGANSSTFVDNERAFSPAKLRKLVQFVQRRGVTADQVLDDTGIERNALDGSLSVIGADQLANEKISEIADIAATLPGFDLARGNGSNNPTMTVRGVGTTNPWINNNPSVAAYVDDVYLPFSPLLTLPIFDIERVELLKGPQVALYGRNATAGALNIVTARPDADLGGYIDVSYNGHDLVEGRAAVTPSAERLPSFWAGPTFRRRKPRGSICPSIGRLRRYPRFGLAREWPGNCASWAVGGARLGLSSKERALPWQNRQASMHSSQVPRMNL